MAGKSSWTRLNVWTNSIAAAAARAERSSGRPPQAQQHSSTRAGRSRLPPAVRLYPIASASRGGAAGWRPRIASK